MASSERFIVGYTRDRTGKKIMYHLKDEANALKLPSGNMTQFVLAIPKSTGMPSPSIVAISEGTGTTETQQRLMPEISPISISSAAVFLARLSAMQERNWVLKT